MAKGWVSIHRQIQESFLWNNDEPFSKGQAWIDLLLLACYEDTEQDFNGQPCIVKRGEYKASERNLADRWNWSQKKVRNFIKVLKSQKMLTVRVIRKRSILSIINYDKYQLQGSIEESLKNHRRIIEESQNNKLINNNNTHTLCVPENKIYKSYGKQFQMVKLTESEYQQLIAVCLSKELADELIDDFDLNLSSGKEQDVINHYARLLTYLKYRKNKAGGDNGARKGKEYSGNTPRITRETSEFAREAEKTERLMLGG